ncbi:sodium:solute symporter family transporter [Flexithrix dorotheae]|uniref:sodium:solute symporter family transporter n=1 Tax=Flexithrix dorotheae TaxID=70993 RepID=UPI001B7F8AAA|nr:sodium/solute symporter [Flexithrix dorotheae]
MKLFFINKKRIVSYSIIFHLFLLMSCCKPKVQSINQNNYFTWEEFNNLPPAPGQNQQYGLAGMFAGVHNGALILAGGANFPDGKPWEGGSKKWWDDIYVLEKNGDKYQWYSQKEFKLPFSLAYGVSISTKNGLWCIGGNNEKGVQNNAFLIQWDPISKNIILQDQTSLPFPLANAAGGIIGETIYIAGGETDHNVSTKFLSLNLNKTHANWIEQPAWPGKARSHALGLVQSNGDNDCFYLLGGRQLQNSGISEVYYDGFCFNPTKNSWESLSHLKNKNGELIPFSAATGVTFGSNSMFVIGGSNGDLLNKLQKYEMLISKAEKNERVKLIEERDIILNQHPGFSKKVYAYQTITNSWRELNSLPNSSQVTTQALVWDGEIIIPSGEISPGIRTKVLLKGTPQKTESFGWINYTVVIAYLLILVGIGFIFSKNQKNTTDFFKAGGRIPWWAAGISIFGTQLSAITFMAIPAKAYATDWSMFFMLMTVIMVAPLIIHFFLPFFRRLNLTSAYEYLEQRFNTTTRQIGAAMYVIMQISRLGIVLLLPSLALSVVTGIDVSLCILIMGVLSIIYTVLGGIEAVIWTDVMQVIVLLGGALFCLIWIPIQIGSNSSEIWQQISSNGKFNPINLDFNFSQPTLWVVIIGGIASNIIQYGSDQTVIQRYLTTRDEKSAANGIKTGAWMVLPSALIFFSIGTALFLFFKNYPETLNPTLDNTDTIFPWYIVSQLPDGISGVLIAAIFAAAMSSLDSSMNSVATVITNDFYKLFKASSNEYKELEFARKVTVIIGVLGTGTALLMANLNILSLWDQFNEVIGLFAGGLGGLFLLGIFTQKAHGTGALIGLVLSGFVQYYVKVHTSLHLLLYAFTGMISAFILGYIFSLLLPRNSSGKSNLTYINVNKINNNKKVPVGK